jgi:hypothetical protein
MAKVTDKPKRANLKLLALGTVPPILLMVLAYFLNLLWVEFHASGIFIVLMVLGAAIVLFVVMKEFYIPWIARDRALILNRVLKSLSLPLIATVYCSGYRDVALALAGIAVILIVKDARERKAVEADDETSWYYVGESPEKDHNYDNISAAGSDPYEVLGISKGASAEEIKTAYRGIIKACHPDSNGGVGDTARFRMATEAYKSLMGD